MNRQFFTLLIGIFFVIGSKAFAQEAVSSPVNPAKEEFVVELFRVNNPSEYLYEESGNKQLNFLSVEGNNQEKNTGILLKYARGKVMPQYLIYLNASVQKSDNQLAARFLVSLKDSVDHYKDDEKKQEQFMLNKEYIRLAFVDGILYNDSLLVIRNSAKENPEDNKIDIKSVKENGEGEYCPALFSLRLINSDGEQDFLLESWAGNIGSTEGEWVNIQNGVPVIVKSTLDKAKSGEAEVFNFKESSEEPSANQHIADGTGSFQVIAGQGQVIVLGAAEKNVALINSTGQILSNGVVKSDKAVLSAPSGVIIVSVDGQQAIKVVVK